MSDTCNNCGSEALQSSKDLGRYCQECGAPNPKSKSKGKGK